MPFRDTPHAVDGQTVAAVIFIKESYIAMKTNLSLRNPLQFLGGQSEDILAPGQFGGVLARAGVGKTALMVQIALNSMLNGRNVLHISLNQPVNKASLWYRDIFGHTATSSATSQPGTPRRRRNSSGNRSCRTGSS